MSLAKYQQWADVKRAYLAGEGSLRTLSERFGVSLNTLEKRCRREHWRQDMAVLGGIVTAEAAKAAAEGGREMGQTAVAFEQRSKDETWLWMDRIEGLASGNLDADTALKLVNARRSTISVGRQAYRLDEPEAAAPMLQLSKIEVHFHQPDDGVIDCPPPSLPESCAAEEPTLEVAKS